MMMMTMMMVMMLMTIIMRMTMRTVHYHTDPPLTCNCKARHRRHGNFPVHLNMWRVRVLIRDTTLAPATTTTATTANATSSRSLGGFSEQDGATEAGLFLSH